MSGRGLYFGLRAARLAEEGAAKVARIVAQPLRRELTVAHVLAEVSTEFDVPVRDLLGPWRSQRLARPRAAAMALARRHTMASLPVIAREMQRDHTTVITGIRRHAEREAVDPEFAARVAAVSERLQRRLNHV